MKLDSYSEEKLSYIFLSAMQIMNTLHKKGIYYGDMKP